MPRPLEKRLQALDRPLVFLALFAVLLYLAQLFRLVPASLRLPAFWVSFAIDLTFLVDLIAKCAVLGRSYLKSPWFVIDLISTTPVIGSAIEAFALVGPHLRFMSAVRIARVARVGRAARLASIARVARVARALRVARGLQFLRVVPAHVQRTPAFDRALRLGVPTVLACFVGLASYVEHLELSTLRADLAARVQQARTRAELEALPGRLPPAALLREPLTAHLVLHREEGGQRHRLLFAAEPALARSDRVQGLLVVFLLLTVVTMAAMGRGLARDQRRGAEAAILEQCFSPPIVDSFFHRPEILDRYYQPWMSVFFIDVRGFTAATQRHAGDLEGLALRLRQVMDIAREEIVVGFHGVVDKFMGDAVMGWIGGQFSRHWATIAELREVLLFDALEAAANDVNTLARELARLESENERELQGRRGNADELRGALEEARARLRAEEERQRELLAASPDLHARHEAAEREYQRQVARAAVLCMLRISERVAGQGDPEAFRELKIGVASGPVCVGNFGSTEQVGFTILGPTVNRAARLEPASHQCGCRVLVDQATFELCGEDEALAFRRWGGIEVKGIEGQLPVYEPLRVSAETRALLETFHRARERAEAGALEEARALFQRADAERPGGDPAARHWVTSVEAALAQGSRELATYRASKG